MKYINTRFLNNTDKINFPLVGYYEIPQILPEEYEPIENWLDFNSAVSEKDRKDKGVHFFLDDYRFERVWHDLKRYAEMLTEYQAVTSPDFSLFTDYPLAVQLWNHYRKHYIGAYLQRCGIKVYPSICWSDSRSFDFCFDGEPIGGCIAISSVGTQMSKETKRNFLAGYEEMIKRLEPTTILFYGTVPKECDGNIVKINAFQEKWG